MYGLLSTHKETGHDIVSQIPGQQSPDRAIGHIPGAGGILHGLNLLLLKHHVLRPLRDQGHIALIRLHWSYTALHGCGVTLNGAHTPLHGAHAGRSSVLYICM